MSMTVDDLSRRTGVTANTIRYYTRIGLLRPHRHPANGYRLFDETDFKLLLFIGKAKRLGLSLSEIQGLIRTAEAGGPTCAMARTIVAQRALEVRRQIADLEALHHDMNVALGAWESQSDDARGDGSICPLIEAFVPTRPGAAHRDGNQSTKVSSRLVPVALGASE
jgi:MerR family transcriptional regulator, Zn(II)-responsive regulator of zntA